jgi:hypothetical protein
MSSILQLKNDMRVPIALYAVLCTCLTIGLAGQDQPSFCRPAARPVFLNDVREVSGVAVGRAAPGTLWTINDSGEPLLYKVGVSGQATRVRVAGGTVRDWEDLALAKCQTGECLYIGDIGDNRGSRKQITIYRVPEPADGATATKAAELFHATYADGPHDAEAFLIIEGQLLVITKEMPSRIYRSASPLKPGATTTLEFVRALGERIRVTGAALSGDGRWVALRSNTMMMLFRLEDFMKGGNPVKIDLRALKEPQGEGVAFGSAGDVYLVSEGGDDTVAGMVTRLHCALPK